MSCLIPKDNLDSYNIERMGINLLNEEEAKIVKEDNNKISSKTSYFTLNNHPTRFNKGLLEQKTTIFNEKILMKYIIDH